MADQDEPKRPRGNVGKGGRKRAITVDGFNVQRTYQEKYFHCQNFLSYPYNLNYFSLEIEVKCTQSFPFTLDRDKTLRFELPSSPKMHLDLRKLAVNIINFKTC